jgi:hypothetical protein
MISLSKARYLFLAFVVSGCYEEIEVVPVPPSGMEAYAIAQGNIVDFPEDTSLGHCNRRLCYNTVVHFLNEDWGPGYGTVTTNELLANSAGFNYITVQRNNTGGDVSTVREEEIPSLAKAVKCFDDRCTGQKTVFNGTQEVTIQHVFSDGWAVITPAVKVVGALKYIIPVSSLKPKYLYQVSSEKYVESKDPEKGNCPAKICAKNRVLKTSLYQAATVQEVFENGKVSVLIDGVANAVIWDFPQFSKGVQCFEGYCEGERILKTSTYVVGKILEVFTSGHARVQFDGVTTTNVVQISEIVKSVPSAGRQGVK